MSDINYRRNGKKYGKSLKMRAWTKPRRKASKFWKRYHGKAKAIRRIVIEIEYEKE